MAAPFKKFRTQASTGLSLNLWVNGEGKTSFSINKRYKAKDEWKDTTTLYAQDLAALLALIPGAIQVAETLRESEKPASTADQEVAAQNDDVPF